MPTLLFLWSFKAHCFLSYWFFFLPPPSLLLSVSLSSSLFVFLSLFLSFPACFCLLLRCAAVLVALEFARLAFSQIPFRSFKKKNCFQQSTTGRQAQKERESKRESERERERARESERELSWPFVQGRTRRIRCNVVNAINHFQGLQTIFEALLYDFTFCSSSLPLDVFQATVHFPLSSVVD